MEMERQNKKMQVWNLLAEKIRKLVEESVSNPEELQDTYRSAAADSDERAGTGSSGPGTPVSGYERRYW